MSIPYTKTIWLRDHIQLPDGRTFLIQQLTNRVSDRQSITLRSHVQQRRRYTIEERRWIASLNLDQIQQHFVCTPESARNLLAASRRIVNDLYTTTHTRPDRSHETHPDHG